jgi:hypothetical protein
MNVVLYKYITLIGNGNHKRLREFFQEEGSAYKRLHTSKAVTLERGESKCPNYFHRDTQLKVGNRDGVLENCLKQAL